MKNSLASCKQQSFGVCLYKEVQRAVYGLPQNKFSRGGFPECSEPPLKLPLLNVMHMDGVMQDRKVGVRPGSDLCS